MPWTVPRAVPSAVLVAALPVGRGGWEDRVKEARREEDKGGRKAQDNFTVEQGIMIIMPCERTFSPLPLGLRRVPRLLFSSVGVGPFRGTRNPQGALPGDPGGSCFPLRQPPRAWEPTPGEGGC